MAFVRDISDQRDDDNIHKFEDLTNAVKDNTASIQRLEEKFDKILSKQQKLIDNISEKLVEVDFNRKVFKLVIPSTFQELKIYHYFNLFEGGTTLSSMD